MKNERGEVVTGLAVLIMLGMCIFGGIALMRGIQGHDGHSDHGKKEQQAYPEKDTHQMDQTDGENASQPAEGYRENEKNR